MNGTRLSPWLASVILAPLFAVGCSTDSGPGTSATTVPATSSSVGPAAPSAVSADPDCSGPALERDLGALGFSSCSDEWAAVMPASYTDVCTDCESIWLARWDGSGWRLTAQCHAFTILTAGENGCSGVGGSFPDPIPTGSPPTEVPPPAVACEIWAQNTLEENLAVTGCEPG